MRSRLFLLFGAAVAVATVVGGWLWWQHAREFVETENAYVVAEVANVMAQAAGSVAEVRAEEMQIARRGDVLVVLDDADAKLALAQAEAELARVSQHVRQYFEGGRSSSSEVAYAQTLVDSSRTELERLRRLGNAGAVSAQDLTRAQAAFDTATAGLQVARSRQSEQAALTARSTVNTHPEILAARAAVDAAKLALDRTVVRAPIDGSIAQKRVSLGQRLQVGSPLLNLVPLDRVHVVANFKEGQLTRVRPGQAVTLYSDLYGSDVVYRGTVRALASGTGAAFAVIPAQNATGAWIKVVQRVPVRIDLDPAELRAHPLRVGLSMHASIRTTESATP